MSKLSTTMKMVSGADTYQVGFYTTTAEASAYGDYGAAEVDGTLCYYGLGTGVDVVHGSGVKTPLQVNKGGTNYYMLTKGNAELATYTLTLAATSNQTITLKYKNRNLLDNGYETEVTKTSTNSVQNFTVRNGTTWTATLANATGWTAGTLSPGTSGTVSAATTVSASAATYKTFTLTLSATSNQTITLKYKNKKSDGTFESEVTKTSTGSAQSFTVGYGTTWTASVAGATGWTAGALSPGTSGTITAAVTISAAAATYKTFTLTLAAMNTNQTITLKYKNKKSDGTFESEVTKTSTGSAQAVTVGYGTTWTASVSPSTGWNAGALSPGASGIVTATTTVSCAAATYKTFTLTKSATNASTNQTLTVQYQNKTSSGIFDTKTTLSSGSVTLGYGSHWWGTVSNVTTGWNAGAITNAGGDSSSLTSNITVSIAAATYKSFTLTKSATNASTNQTLTVQYQNKASSGSFGTKTTLSSGSASLGYGSHWWGTASPSTGWNAGAVTNPGGDSSSLTSNITVSVAAATHKTFTLTLAAATNQTITLKYKDYNGSSFASEVTKTSTSSAQSFTVGYGTTWTATIAGASGYNAGTLSASSGTVTAATTVSASAATVNDAIIMGIVLSVEGGGEGTWVRVDKNYNTISFNSNHKTWKNIKTVQDATYGKFVEIPVSYVKTEKIASGKYAGKTCWWIADAPANGFHVHPCFMGPDGKAHNLQIGVSVAYNNNGVPNAYYEGYEWGAISYNEVHAKGWMSGNVRPYSIYDHSFLLRMMLIEFGTSQAIYTSVLDNPDYGGSEIRFYIYGDHVYHGIKDPFATSGNDMILDGFTSLNGTFQVLKPDGSRNMVETGVSCPSSWYRWPINCKINKANGIDFGDLFIGDSLGGQSEASFPDVQNFDSNMAYSVARNSYDSYGPFGLSYWEPDRQNNYLLWRISKMAS